MLNCHFLHSVCKLGSNKFVVTGSHDYFFADGARKAEVYDSDKNQWEELPDLNAARRMHSSCAIGTTVYVFRGMTKNQKLINTVEKYDIASNETEWTDMFIRGLMPRVQSGIAVIEHEVILLGGSVNHIGTKSAGATSSAVLIYDTKKDELRRTAF